MDIDNKEVMEHELMVIENLLTKGRNLDMSTQQENEYSSIPVIVGLGNWIAVLLILGIFFSKSMGLKSYAISHLLGIYLLLSFIPALISIAIAMKEKKGYRIVIIALNVIFLLFYIVGFLLSLHSLIYR